jgi:hypothetical protein
LHARASSRVLQWRELPIYIPVTLHGHTTPVTMLLVLINKDLLSRIPLLS